MLIWNAGRWVCSGNLVTRLAGASAIQIGDIQIRDLNKFISLYLELPQTVVV
jgi:hypothetical protein